MNEENEEVDRLIHFDEFDEYDEYININKYYKNNSNKYINPLLINIFDNFYSYELENILDIYDCIKNIYPYFLNCNSIYFTEFIFNHIFVPNQLYIVPNQLYKDYYYNNFETIYNEEINHTFKIINDYLNTTSKKYNLILPLKRIDWIKFCIRHN